jgi:hypothetical protein
METKMIKTGRERERGEWQGGEKTSKRERKRGKE